MQDIVWTPAEDDQLETQRAFLRKSLSEITGDVGVAMRDAGLTFPVSIIIPHSGNSFAMIGSPLGPSDVDCQRAIAIICEVVGKRLGGRQLCGRELTCAVANGATSAVDIVAEAGEGDVRHPDGVPRIKATAPL